ncbi:MarR family winged helix-turn-helix transcriptional regulator [Inconstantimicrobium mannanitabidum]|uniref:MarR family transcriptional regulator n=1 Tax=Inconstantimicrobium mannanitabidum TaxID=1604901 RepID=A0ACB5R8E1_9CLOT|nr:MarR family transcriptional regulator [Clostridium sp. TW13]GKX65397.1 MarR family transcriptional regulator [Clostridium sp. TW13]
MNKSEHVLNKLLVQLFNELLEIEHDALKNGPFSDLSITEIHTIEAIGMYTPRTMSEVASDLKITVGTLTTAVNKLIKKEYVTRERIEEDRRVVMIRLTKKGKLAYRVHEKFHSDMIKETIKGIDDKEEEILISSLEKLSAYFTYRYHLSNTATENK